jgi:hypothetical protein
MKRLLQGVFVSKVASVVYDLPRPAKRGIFYKEIAARTFGSGGFHILTKGDGQEE